MINLFMFHFDLGPNAVVKIVEETDAPARAEKFNLEKMTKIIYLITNK